MVQDMEPGATGNKAVMQAQVVLKVKRLCLASQECALRVAAGKYGAEIFECDSHRYGRSRIDGILLADTLDDEFFRSAALRPIIELCMIGGDVDDARALLKHVKIAFIRSRILDRFPELSGELLASFARYAVAAE
jgi:hypothetical protein